MDAIGFVKLMVGVNGLVLFVMGLGMLTCGERLKLRAPIVKGLLYVGLYYVAMIVLGTVLTASSESRARAVYSLMTPAGAFYWDPSGQVNQGALLIQIWIGLAIQLLAILALVTALRSRLSSR